MLTILGSQCVKKQSKDFSWHEEGLFTTQLTRQWALNMIKVMWCRFEQCSGRFTMLLVEVTSETTLFRHLSDYVCAVRNFERTKCMRVIFSFKMFKIWSRFQKCSKNWEKKKSCFWYICIWHGIVKLSPLRTGNFW